MRFLQTLFSFSIENFQKKKEKTTRARWCEENVHEPQETRVISHKVADNVSSKLHRLTVTCGSDSWPMSLKSGSSVLAASLA